MTTAAGDTAQQPMPPAAQRWLAYFKQRFKIGTNLFATVLLVGTAGMAALHYAGQSLNYYNAVPLAVMALVYFLIFLHLRIFDEHKDYAVDSVRFPERVLSKGWVTLAQLRKIAYVVIPLELLLSMLVGTRFVGATMGLIAYSLLMLKEFFIANWLKRHMVIYGVSHMAILYLMVLGVFDGLGDSALPGVDLYQKPLMLYAANAFFWVYSLEIARKIRVPEAEKPDVDTYSKILGPMGAVYATVVCQAIGLVFLRSSRLYESSLGWMVINGVFALGAILMFQQVRSNDARKLEKLDNVAALPFITLQIALLVGWYR
jgi:4-hydroxybenzoate polyprenyltransferase